MEWFDLTNELSREPGGVLELPPGLTPLGYALELHVFVGRGDCTTAWWMLEDGSHLSQAIVGTA
jgi:hypothetical protein